MIALTSRTPHTQNSPIDCDGVQLNNAQCHMVPFSICDITISVEELLVSIIFHVCVYAHLPIFIYFLVWSAMGLSMIDLLLW